MTGHSQRGLALMELLVAMLISGVLISGLVQIASAARSSFRLQENLAGMQENSRYAVNVLLPIIRQAGFSPQPWRPETVLPALTDDSRDALTSSSDRLGIRSFSDLNCYGNPNPAKDGSGRAMFYLRESVFDLNARNELTHSCRFGPDEARLRTQIRRLGLVRNVESFQVLYAEDRNQDGTADQWVKGGHWLSEQDVLGVRVGLLLSSEDAAAEAASRIYQILDRSVEPPADGKIRRALELMATFRGRSG